jgi:hypothetical protein
MSSAPNEEVGGRRYSFRLSPEEEAAFLHKVDSLRIGDSIDKVKSVLGEPAEDRALVEKSGKFNSRVLRYFVRRIDGSLSNEHDRFVSFYCSASGTVTEIKRHLP